MTWAQVASESTYLTFFLVLLVVQAIIHGVFLSWNRLMRHMNIRKNGWPPLHCDADGDGRSYVEDTDEGL